MTTTVQKWGNSLAVRLPKELMDSMGIKAGTPVTFTNKKDCFEIKPAIKKSAGKKYNLKKMVASITAQNRHSEFDWGKPMGKEIW